MENAYQIIGEPHIRSWPGGGPYVAGYCVEEIRHHEDGRVEINMNDAIYIHEHPEISEIFQIYRTAEAALLAYVKRANGVS